MSEKLGTNLAEAGTDDLISRQQAYNLIMGQPPEVHYPSWYAEQIMQMRPAQKIEDLNKLIKALEEENKKLREMQSATDKNVGTKYDELEIVRAISGLTEWQKHVQTDSNIDRDITVAIEALKAQLGMNLAEVGTDTISRQAAIDAIENAFDRETILNRFVRKIAISAVRLLPSAQPEIIRCKDCKEYDPIYTGGAGVCGHWNAKTENNAYCSYAERRKG